MEIRCLARNEEQRVHKERYAKKHDKIKVNQNSEILKTQDSTSRTRDNNLRMTEEHGRQHNGKLNSHEMPFSFQNKTLIRSLRDIEVPSSIQSRDDQIPLQLRIATVNLPPDQEEQKYLLLNKIEDSPDQSSEINNKIQHKNLNFTIVSALQTGNGFHPNSKQPTQICPQTTNDLFKITPDDMFTLECISDSPPINFSEQNENPSEINIKDKAESAKPESPNHEGAKVKPKFVRKLKTCQINFDELYKLQTNPALFQRNGKLVEKNFGLGFLEINQLEQKQLLQQNSTKKNRTQQDQSKSEGKFARQISMSKRGVPFKQFQQESHLKNLRSVAPVRYVEILPYKSKQKDTVDINFDRQIQSKIDEIISKELNTQYNSFSQNQKVTPYSQNFHVTQRRPQTNSFQSEEQIMEEDLQQFQYYCESGKKFEITPRSLRNNELLSSRKIDHVDYRNIPLKQMRLVTEKDSQEQKLDLDCKALEASTLKSKKSSIDSNVSPRILNILTQRPASDRSIGQLITISPVGEPQILRLRTCGRKNSQESQRPNSGHVLVTEIFETLHDETLITEKSSQNFPLFNSASFVQKNEGTFNKNKSHIRSQSKYEMSNQTQSNHGASKFRMTGTLNNKVEIEILPTNLLMKIENNSTQLISINDNTSQCTLKTEVDLDEDGNELIEARDFGIGTDTNDDYENLEHHDNHLRELDQMDLLSNLRQFPFEMQPSLPVKESYNVRRAAIKEFYKEYSKDMKLKASKLYNLETRGQRIIYKSLDGSKQIINPGQAEILSPQALAQMTLSGRHVDNVKPIVNFNAIATPQQSFTINFWEQQMKMRLVPNFVRNYKQNNKQENNPTSQQPSPQRIQLVSHNIKKKPNLNTDLPRTNDDLYAHQQSPYNITETLKMTPKRGSLLSTVKSSVEDCDTVYMPPHQRCQIESQPSRNTSSSPFQTELPAGLNYRRTNYSGRKPNRQVSDNVQLHPPNQLSQKLKVNKQSSNQTPTHNYINQLEESTPSVDETQTPAVVQPIQIVMKQNTDFIKSLEFNKHPTSTNSEEEDNRLEEHVNSAIHMAKGSRLVGHVADKFQVQNNQKSAINMAKGSKLFSTIANQLSTVFNPVCRSSRRNNMFSTTLGNRHWLNSKRNTENIDENDVKIHTIQQQIKVYKREANSQQNTMRNSNHQFQNIIHHRCTHHRAINTAEGNIPQRQISTEKSYNQVGLAQEEKPEYQINIAVLKPFHTVQPDDRSIKLQNTDNSSIQVQTLKNYKANYNAKQIQTKQLNMNLRRIQQYIQVEQAPRVENHLNKARLTF